MLGRTRLAYMSFKATQCTIEGTAAAAECSSWSMFQFHDLKGIDLLSTAKTSLGHYTTRVIAKALPIVAIASIASKLAAGENLQIMLASETYYYRHRYR